MSYSFSSAAAILHTLALAAASGLAGEVATPQGVSGVDPVSVSPGGTDAIETVATPCPTFLWSADARATSVELAVFPLPEAPDDALQRSVSGKPVLSNLLPGSAPGWTPPLELCLDPGGEYAWAVREIEPGSRSTGPWSQLRVFRVHGSLSERPREPSAAIAASKGESAGNPTETLQAESATKGRADQKLGDKPLVLPRLPQARAASTALAPDPFAGASLSLSSNLRLGPDSNVFKDGSVLLWDDEFVNGVGGGNTALGRGGLTSLDSASSLNTAVGWNALPVATNDSDANVAIGSFALGSLNSGDNNVAIGELAGNALQNGSGNTYINASTGPTAENNAVRIGDANDTTYLAGKVAMGLAPDVSLISSTELFLTSNVSGSSIGTHPVLIRNDSTSTNADAMALWLRVPTPTSANNYLTFYRGSGTIAGEIEGNSGGGVVYKSSSADYAEFLPRLDPSEVLEPGDVVGVYGGAVSRRTRGADRVQVVSTAPLLLGGDPGDEARGAYTKVALLGQIEVKLRGPATAGNLVLASGLEDATAIARPAADVTVDQLHAVLGRVLEDVQNGDGSRRARVLVGLPDSALLATLLEARDQRLERLERTVADLQERLEPKPSS